MKLSTILFAALATSIHGYIVPPATFKAVFPRGLSISIPHDPGLSSVIFNIKINKKFDGLEDGSIRRVINKPTDGLWTYKSRYTPVREGDIVYYWLFVVHEGRVYNQIDQSFVFTHYEEEELN